MIAKGRIFIILGSTGLLAAFVLDLFAGPVYAQGPFECTDDFPEDPALAEHIEQSDIDSGALSFEEILLAGQNLFEVQFNLCDGQGRPATTGTGEVRTPDEPPFSRVSGPEANSCAGCHNQPRSGGSGDIVANVFVLGQAADPVLDTTSPEFSNERNTPGMFGAGAIEMLAREITADLHAIRDSAIETAAETGRYVMVSLGSKGVNFGSITVSPDGVVDTRGVSGISADLIVRPFHQSGVVVSLREFSNNAYNHHHGMQSEERFDLNPEAGVDFDQDGIARELTIGDITAVTIWQAALGVPTQVLPSDPDELAAVTLGEILFDAIGCASCHIPEMRLEDRFYSEPNPYNPPGNWNDTSHPYTFDMTAQGEGPFLQQDGAGAIVRAYTDFKRHNLCDPETDPDPIRVLCDEHLVQGRPNQDGRPGQEFFITRRLWDVGNSGPYGHRGNLTTITEAIWAHGGEGRSSRDVFVALPVESQRAIIAFLQTLQVVPPNTE